MNVESIMTTRVATVGMDDTLEIVKEIFDNAHFNHLLVIDDDKRLVGVISDRDLLLSISPYLGSLRENTRDRDTLNQKSHQVMSRDPATIRKDASIIDAAQKILAITGSCLPIVDSENKIEGILSWKDILAALIEKTVP